MLIAKNRFKSSDKKERTIAWIYNIMFFIFVLCSVFIAINYKQITQEGWIAYFAALYGIIAGYIVTSDAYIKEYHFGTHRWFLSRLNIKFSKGAVDNTKEITGVVFYFGLIAASILFLSYLLIDQIKFEVLLFAGILILNIAFVSNVPDYLDGKIMSESEILLIEDVKDFTENNKQDFLNKVSRVIKNNHLITREDLRLIFIEIYEESLEEKRKEKGNSEYKNILNKRGE